MEWAYRITTTPDRQYNYFPKTLEALKVGGFTHPTIFVDDHHSTGTYERYGLPVVYRNSKIRAYGHWLMSLLELWIRYPVQRFAIFQDDFVCYRNLRQYLDNCHLPDDGYWNLLTFPQNEALAPPNRIGWYPSNQRGRGAVALVFGHTAVFKLLTNQMVMAKPKAKENPDRCIDGLIVTAANNMGLKEWCHYPTLVYHMGDCSSIGNRQHVKSRSFRGEDYDAMEMIHK